MAGQGGQERGGQEEVGQEKRWWMELRRMATHHLGHGNNQWPGLRLHLHPGNRGARTKRASVLIGNHEPIGATQTNRVSVLDCDRRVPGSHHSYGSEEWSPHLQGHLQEHSWRRKQRLVVTGYHLSVISATSLVLSWVMRETVTDRFHARNMTLLAHFFLLWPFGSSQSINCCTVCDFNHVRCDEKKKKRVFVETLLVVTHLADLLSALIQKRKNRYSFVGSCPVSTVFSSRTVYRERTNNNHKVVAERWLLEDRTRFRWVSIVQSLNNTDDEWQWGRSRWLPNLFNRKHKALHPRSFSIRSQ